MASGHTQPHENPQVLETPEKQNGERAQSAAFRSSIPSSCLKNKMEEKVNIVHASSSNSTNIAKASLTQLTEPSGPQLQLSMSFNSNSTSVVVNREVSFTPEITAVILGCYIAFCKFFGPWLMKDREPFSLRIPMLIYTIGQILMNSYLSYMCYSLLGIEMYSFWSNVCYPVTSANMCTNVADEVYSVCFFFAVNKAIDLLDTVFFILRKKTDQVTTPHVFHHITIFGATVLTENLNEIEEVLIKMICLNSTLHVILHFYYLLCGINHSSDQKYHYLKKYMSMMLILEMVILLIILVLYSFTCHYLTAFLVIWVSEFGILFCLFSNYYRTTYMKKNKKQ
ncbi:very long chain fatty acid elongase 1 [Halyomorpha halys]|uniref:very long chain fatty acid elongase 1 n=1 Tax=Halyomorpha halys TaxID=286706 RepID=UPI0006D4F2BA|nr:elongation of very long chain fatty acids protein 1-like [Halyomorpha halys]